MLKEGMGLSRLAGGGTGLRCRDGEGRGRGREDKSREEKKEVGRGMSFRDVRGRLILSPNGCVLAA
jgi:hypothetical protein